MGMIYTNIFHNPYVRSFDEDGKRNIDKSWTLFQWGLRSKLDEDYHAIHQAARREVMKIPAVALFDQHDTSFEEYLGSSPAEGPGWIKFNADDDLQMLLKLAGQTLYCAETNEVI